MTSQTNTDNVPVPAYPSQLVLLIDESGSMGGARNATIKAANAFVDAIKGTQGLVELTVAKFTDYLHQIIVATPLAESRPITTADYNPSGGNLIQTSIVRQIQTLESRIGKGPGNVVFVVQTDGGEGDGTAAYWRHARNAIARKEAQGWRFLLLFADHSKQMLDQLSPATKAHIRQNNPAYWNQLTAPPNLGSMLGIPAEREFNYEHNATGAMQGFLAAATKTAAVLYGTEEPPTTAAP